MKVCILGSGLSSLSLAKGLINLGLRVDVFSNNLKNIYNKSQTIGISKTNIEFFNKNIIKINKFLWDINNIEIQSENLEFEKILNFEDNNQTLFSVIENYKLYDFLLTNLKKNKLFNHKKNPINLAIINKYDLIINTFANNQISKKFFFKKIEKKYDSFGYITIIHHKKIKSNKTATQIFTKKGPLAFLPISDNKTSIVYSMRGEIVLTKKELLKFIKVKFNKLEIKKVESLKKFDLKSSNLRVYYHKNILAFGDELHRIHPLAGQGFNMVIRDIKLLIDLITTKKNLGLKLDSSICVDFEKKIKSPNFLFSSGIDFIYEFFKFESKINNNLLSKSIQFFGKNKSMTKFLTRVADKGIII